MRSNPVRVLVVDDSAYLRKVVSEMLLRSPQIEVVGAARNGLDALEMVAELQPDVVTLDLIMPEMDGVEFLKTQMARRPLPVVVLSIASELGEKAVAAMEAGAIEFIRKPTALSSDQIYQIADELIEKVLAAASVPAEKLQAADGKLAHPGLLPPGPARGTVEALVIGVSTGGPQALRYLLPQFPPDFPAPVGIVLHMPVGFTGPLAQKLNETSRLDVLEATEGLEMRPGRAILGQAGTHFFLQRAGDRVFVHLDLSPADLLHRPSVDVLFRSAAEIYGSRTLGVVLTGMGDDGRLGSAWIKAQGGQVFAEDESTSIIFGMPRSVIEAGLADRVVPLDAMVATILETI